ncbi:MAG: TraR/DksA C4-type zinc finger protein [Actinomycetota bacterium]|nr:TraR/DksA C4-type zinc finger protein [Actinomycetota bacterium]
MASDAPSVEMRALLERERDALRHQLEELGFGGEGSGLDYDANFADTSQVTAERGEAEALAGSLREALDEVERALAKLDEGTGTYGLCEACGRPINAPRLEAMPAARHCIDCASQR